MADLSMDPSNPPSAATQELLIFEEPLSALVAAPGGVASERVARTLALLHLLGAREWPGVTFQRPAAEHVDNALLQRYHRGDYVQAVTALSGGQASLLNDAAFGFAAEGVQPFAGMDQASRTHVAALQDALAWLAGRASAARVFVPAGVQFHARPAQAVSEGIFNDVLLALVTARERWERVAFVSLEPEHPTAIQEAFYEDSGLLFISLHEDGEFLYPGGGAPAETGAAQGRGFTANLPLPPGTGDAVYRQAMESVVEPLLERFSPELLVVLGGSAAHVSEPVAHLRLTSRGYQELIERLAARATRLLVAGGMGARDAVTARLWALGVATLAGQKGQLPERLPADYLERWPDRSEQLQDAPRVPLHAEYSGYVARLFDRRLRELGKALFPLWEMSPPPPAIPAPAPVQESPSRSISVSLEERGGGASRRPQTRDRRPSASRSGGGDRRGARSDGSEPAPDGAVDVPPEQDGATEAGKGKLRSRRRRRRRRRRGGGKN